MLVHMCECVCVGIHTLIHLFRVSAIYLADKNRENIQVSLHSSISGWLRVERIQPGSVYNQEWFSIFVLYFFLINTP